MYVVQKFAGLIIGDGMMIRVEARKEVIIVRISSEDVVNSAVVL